MQQPISFSRHDAADYRLVLQAIEYVKNKHPRLPSLHVLAQALDITPKHWQRVVERWTGSRPLCYVRHLSLRYSRNLSMMHFAVPKQNSISSLSGRSKGLSITWETKSLEKRRLQRGKGLTISYGRFVSPFGEVLSLGTEQGLCGMVFCDEKRREKALTCMKWRWPEAEFVDKPGAVKSLTKTVFEGGEVQLQIMGTQFQLDVWETLLTIPSGKWVRYKSVARKMGKSLGAARAVGQANSFNPMPWLIPCHRVLKKKDGTLDGFHLSEYNNRAMLAWEAFRSDATD